MNWKGIKRDSRTPAKVLVLQGGGALGSYQAGVFEALDAAAFCPEWVAGTSIGAINGALIAGNHPGDRLSRLKEFWDLVTSGLMLEADLSGKALTGAWHQWAAAMTAVGGAPGFFKPHWPPVAPWLAGPLGHYDTSPLRETLERLIDWDLLNSEEVRLSVGAVNVESGNFRYFDTEHERLGPEHVMASAALPPGFEPVLINGQYWWDGGLVSNTPLEHVLDMHDRTDIVVIQVDLFPARGPLPASIAEAEERVSDIRFSSRTRLVTNAGLKLDAVRKAGRKLLESLPGELLETREARALAREVRSGGRVAIGQLIYRDQPVRGAARGREFSRATMHAHWTAGRRDMTGGMACALKLAHDMPEGISSHDLTAPPALDLQEAAE
ncbi:patatin-like phospholipase family protein [Polymorphobacter sp.]|uniref:patatin-like phospholipase family protein n=1 Tax=Polymorphobacter sp. TaxID=1909290 RepID=UPI003F6EA57E